MPFVVIKGSFHLVGKSSQGNATGFEPDGDSMQFKPDNATLLDRLDRVGRPYRLSSIGSTQLRFEGIDALELHFEGHHQPRPLADDARDYLTGLLGMNPVPYRPPKTPPSSRLWPMTAPADTSSRGRSKPTGVRSHSPMPAIRPWVTARS